MKWKVGWAKKKAARSRKVQAAWTVFYAARAGWATRTALMRAKRTEKSPGTNPRPSRREDY